MSLPLRVFLLLLALLALGGCRSGNGESNTSPSSQEVRVFQIQTTDDLLQLRLEYMRLHEAGFDGTLEIHIQPGSYTPAGWDLLPDPQGKRANAASTIDVLLKGAPSVLPETLSGIRARDLRLEGLVLTGLRTTALSLQVERHLSLVNCALVDARWADPFGGEAWLQVEGRGGKRTPIAIDVSDSWFVRSFQTPEMAMLGFRAAHDSQAYFEEISFRRCAFLGNAFARELSIKLARLVRLEDCLYYKTWPAGVLLDLKSVGSAMVSNSIFMVESLDHLVKTTATPDVSFTGSRVLVRGRQAGGVLPAGLKLDASAVGDAAAFSDAEAGLAAAVAMGAAALPPLDLFDQLKRSLGAFE